MADDVDAQPFAVALFGIMRSHQPHDARRVGDAVRCSDVLDRLAGLLDAVGIVAGLGKKPVRLQSMAAVHDQRRRTFRLFEQSSGDIA